MEISLAFTTRVFQELQFQTGKERLGGCKGLQSLCQ